MPARPARVALPVLQTRTVTSRLGFPLLAYAFHDAVNKIAPQLKVTQALPGTAWIEEGGNHQLAQAQLETSPGNNLQMTLTDWGKPVTVNKPDVQ